MIAASADSGRSRAASRVLVSPRAGLVPRRFARRKDRGEMESRRVHTTTQSADTTSRPQAVRRDLPGHTTATPESERFGRRSRPAESAARLRARGTGWPVHSATNRITRTAVAGCSPKEGGSRAGGGAAPVAVGSRRRRRASSPRADPWDTHATMRSAGGIHALATRVRQARSAKPRVSRRTSLSVHAVGPASAAPLGRRGSDQLQHAARPDNQSKCPSHRMIGGSSSSLERRPDHPYRSTNEPP